LERREEIKLLLQQRDELSNALKVLQGQKTVLGYELEARLVAAVVVKVSPSKSNAC